jgi:hypothetical protein
VALEEVSLMKNGVTCGLHSQATELCRRFAARRGGTLAGARSRHWRAGLAMTIEEKRPEQWTGHRVEKGKKRASFCRSKEMRTEYQHSE